MMEQESRSGYSAEDMVQNEAREEASLLRSAATVTATTTRRAPAVDDGDGSHISLLSREDEIYSPPLVSRQRHDSSAVTPCRLPSNKAGVPLSSIVAADVDSNQRSQSIFRNDDAVLEDKNVRHRRSLSDTFQASFSSTTPVPTGNANAAAVANSETAEMMWLSGPEDEFSFNLPPPLESNQCTPAVQQASQQHMPTIFVNREEVLKEEAKFANASGAGVAQQHASSDKENLSGPLEHASATANKTRLSLFYFLLRDILVNFWTSDNDADEDDQQYESQQSMNDKCKRVYAFILIPRDLEKFLLLAAFQCFDAFLFVFTLLPLRLLMTLAYLCIYPLRLAKRFLLHRNSTARRKRLWLRPLKPGHASVLLKAGIIVCTLWALSQIDLSFVYHMIKLQSTVKLYMLFNMFEVADRLLSSFGQDILDSLFLAAACTEPPTTTKTNDAPTSYAAKTKPSSMSVSSNPQYFSTATSFLIATCGTFVHSLLIILQLTVLNVAFNSEGQSLLIILMANNFVEIKSNVFKKYNRVNLYHIACTDARERFMSILLLVFIILRNMQDIGWEWKHWSDLGVLMFALIFTEILVDWMKHAFICKFNCLPADVYSDYRVSIAYDMLKWRREGNTVGMLNDQSDAVATKLGFIAVPTCCALIRVIQQSISIETFGVSSTTLNSSTIMQFVLLGVMLYMLLFAVKCLMSVLLLGASLRIMERYVKEMHAAGDADARDTNSEVNTANDAGSREHGGSSGGKSRDNDEIARMRRRHSWNVIVRNEAMSADRMLPPSEDRRKRKFSDLDEDDATRGGGGYAPQSLPSSPVLTRKKLLSLRIGSLNPLPSSRGGPLHVRWNSMRQLNNNNTVSEEAGEASSRVASRLAARAVSYEFVHA